MHARSCDGVCDRFHAINRHKTSHFCLIREKALYPLKAWRQTCDSLFCEHKLLQEKAGKSHVTFDRSFNVKFVGKTALQKSTTKWMLRLLVKSVKGSRELCTSLSLLNWLSLQPMSLQPQTSVLMDTISSCEMCSSVAKVTLEQSRAIAFSHTTRKGDRHFLFCSPPSPHRFWWTKESFPCEGKVHHAQATGVKRCRSDAIEAVNYWNRLNL